MNNRGVLYKRGLVLKKWHSRYCVVVPETQEVIYYEREPSPEDSERKPRGRIGLTGATIQEVPDSVKIFDSDCYAFQLSTKRVKFLLACKTDAERQNWIRAIKLTSDLGSLVEKEDENFSDMDEPISEPRRPTALDAAGKMMGHIETNESRHRDRLIEVANEKWNVKTALRKNKEIITQMRLELEEERKELKEEEAKLRTELNRLNSEISGLDLFCRSSHRLQAEAIKTVSKASSNASAVLTLQKKYAAAMDQPFKSFFDVCMQCFPSSEQRFLSMESDPSVSDYSTLDLFEFYRCYYTMIYLPRKDILDKLKADRFWSWKQLVRVVTKKNSCDAQSNELQIILNHIDAALDSKFRPDFMDSLEEDIPETYNREWSEVLSLIQNLLSLRQEQASIQDALNKVLHNRELLRDWSVEMKYSVSS